MDIKIDINDKSKWAKSKRTQLTLLFSDEKLLKEILLLRKKWTGNKTYDTVDSWIKTLPNPNIYFGKFKLDIARLRKVYKLSLLFDSPLEQAIILGKVTQFERAVPIPIPHHLLEKLENESESIRQEEDYENALVILPETSIEEIKKSLSELKTINKTISKSPGKYPPYRINLPRSDTADNTERDLEWLNLKRQGKSYEDIRKYAHSKGITISRDGVIYAIKQIKRKVCV